MGMPREVPLEYHQTLNPKLWDGDKLRPEVRSALLRFAEAFRDFAGIPKEAVKDVIITGGNANFNWTSYSDIDVHLEVDKEKIAPGTPADLLDDHLHDKKMLWQLQHDPKVAGYPLEPYAEGLKDFHPNGQSSYSLQKDKWLVKPTQKNLDPKHDVWLKKNFTYYSKAIDKLLLQGGDAAKLNTMWDRIVKVRKDAVTAGGEFAPQNLLFKSLRNAGYVDRISKRLREILDKKITRG